MSDPASATNDVFEVIYSARAQRRLRSDPVPEALITRVIDAATRAPSAGNAQNWHFIVIRDAEQRRLIGSLLPQSLRDRRSRLQEDKASVVR
jgi:5,6-dimethylbenzimidazole synthase